MISAILFTWLQNADFYLDLHRDAVEKLPAGEGKRWIDVGCGPGLLSRLAVEKGYDVVGFDTSLSMIHAAKKITGRQGMDTRFEVGDLSRLDEE